MTIDCWSQPIELNPRGWLLRRDNYMTEFWAIQSRNSKKWICLLNKLLQEQNYFHNTCFYKSMYPILFCSLFEVLFSKMKQKNY